MAFLQQAKVLKEDTSEATASVSSPKTKDGDKPQRPSRKPENTAARKQRKKRKRK